MYIFRTYFEKWNFRSHFLRKFLKPLSNKICNVMWGWEISTWRAEEPSWLLHAMHLAVRTPAKISQGWVFHKTMLQMLKENDFDRDGCRTFILHFPCQEMKKILFSRIILKKNASSEILRWGILYLFSISGLDDSFHKQSFLLASIPV